MREIPFQTKDYPRPVVFFDGDCPLCSREIAHYRRLDKHEELEWVDISRDSDLAKQYGRYRTDLMQRFHVLDVRGSWQTGAWGFAEIWAHLPYYRWLALPLRFTRLLLVLNWLYAHFARRRERGRCEDRCTRPQGGRP